MEHIPFIKRNAGPIAHSGAWGVMVIFFLSFMATQMPWLEVLALVLGNFALLAFLFYSHTVFVNRFWETERFGAFFLSGLLIFSLCCTLRYFLNVAFLKKYLVREGVMVFSPEQRLAIFVLTTSFIFAVVAVVYQLIVNRYRRERQNLELIAEQKEAELQFLKAQINPHFLFNALNNLYSLTVTKSDLAPAMLLKLSGLLRYVIYESKKTAVPLEREVAEIQAFIDLFKMRSENPPDIRWTIAGDLKGQSIEPMLLIPLVENCFKHADFDTNPNAFCDVSLKILPDDNFVFKTQNTFDVNDQQKDRVGGVGLDNMQRRLALRYPQRCEFRFAPQNDLFEVYLSIQPTTH